MSLSNNNDERELRRKRLVAESYSRKGVRHGDSVCKNGGCTNVKYRGRLCLNCWARKRFSSIVERITDKNGKHPTYKGLPLGFTLKSMVDWIFLNPEHMEMDKPSIDRIVPELGYVPGNIRWLEMNKNCPGMQRDLADGMRGCPGCKKIFPETTQYFWRNRRQANGLAVYCKTCQSAKNRLRQTHTEVGT